MDKSNATDKLEKRQKLTSKKPYLSPKLVEYGSIVSLTQGTQTKGSDAGVGTMMGMDG